MTVVPGGGDPPPPAALAQAEQALRRGWPVGIPTDTVYGLAADPFLPGATDRIFEAKRRPRNVSLPVLVSGRGQAMALATAVSEGALALMARFWPGPLTIVLPSRPELVSFLGDDDATVGIRCPAHPVPLALCEVAGPLATTSANILGGCRRSSGNRYQWCSTAGRAKGARRPSSTAPVRSPDFSERVGCPGTRYGSPSAADGRRKA